MLRTRFTAALSAPLLALSLTGTLAAQTVDMQSFLDDTQSSATSTATGTSVVVVDTAANTLTFTLQFSGLSSNQTAAHIHGPAAPGSNGGVAFNIGVGSPINGVWNYAQVDEANVLGGMYYINVHTQMNPGGEIRGQITPTPIQYCACPTAPCGNVDASVGCANSSGSGAGLSSAGLSSVSLDSLQLTASNVPAFQNGLFYMGTGQAQLPFGDGQRCAAGQAFRYPIQNAGASGTMTAGPGLSAFAATAFPAAGQINAGSTFYFQCWYRDPAGPCGSAFNLTDALEVSFTP